MRLFDRRNLPALLVGLVLLTITIFMALMFHRYESQMIQKNSDQVAEEAAVALQLQLTPQVDSLRRMTQRAEIFGLPPRANWELDAALARNIFPSIVALSLVDSELRVSWMHPPEMVEFEGALITTDNELRRAFLRAASSGSNSYQGSIKWQDDLHFILIHPIWQNEQLLGYYCGLFNYAASTRSMLPASIAPGYEIQIFDQGELVYDRDPGLGNSTFLSSRAVEVQDLIRWDIAVMPTAAALRSQQSWLDEGVLVMGTLVALLGALLVNHVMSERRERQRSQRAEMRYRHLSEATHQVVWIAGRDGGIIETSSVQKEDLAIPPEQAYGYEWLKIVHPEDRERVERQWRDAVRDRTYFQSEYRMAMRNGSYHHFIERAVPILNDGEVVEWVGALTDVNDQFEAEQALRINEERLRQALRVSRAVAWEIDLDHNCAYRSPETVSILGLTPEEANLHADEYYLRIHPEDQAFMSEQVERTIAELSDFNVEYRIVLPTGEARWIQDQGQVIRDDGGRARRVVGMALDVTERKQTEQKIRELNETLERRVLERTHSLVQYQKRLRQMASELILTEHRERRRLATDLHDYLAQLLVVCRIKINQIETGLEGERERRLGREINELLSSCLTYTRTLIAELSPTVLYESGLFAGLQWLGDQMRPHGLNVQVELGEAPPDHLPDDEAIMIFQGVRELLFNTVKHAGVDQAHLRLNYEDGWLTAEVTDQGKGFDAAAVNREQGKPDKYGLFSIRERLEAMGGELIVESKPGEGTRARMRVPIAMETEEQPAAPSIQPVMIAPARPEPTAGGEIRVMLVDDHAIVREGISSLLENYPDITIVGEAADGLEAIERVQALQPDVVLMDINMPRMNGIEASRHIKREQEHVRVIGLSVNDDPQTEALMREAGAAAYLTKGGSAEELYEAIHSLAAGG